MNHNAKKDKQQEHRFNRFSTWMHTKLRRSLSNFKMSLTFRIAIHYALQLVRSAVMACFVVFLFCTGAKLLQIQSTVERVMHALPQADGTYSQIVVMDDSATAEWLAETMPTSRQKQFRLLMKNIFSKELFSSQPTIMIVAAADHGGMVRVRFQLLHDLQSLGIILLGVVASDILRILHFLRKRHRLDRRVLAPIREMTTMATTLSANNLSNRINVAGMKNELKDLAVVINTMLDRIERSYNSQKQFVSDASHELRTPIAVIRGYVNMLNRWGKEDKSVLEEGITAISQETETMKELVENLLFLARHDKKTLMMEFSTFDPSELLAEVKREATMVCPGDTFILSPVEQMTIKADRAMMKQVLRIFCDNAIKYTPTGGTITLGVRRTPEGCVLSVSDTGQGISQEDLPRIFDRFYRADSARKAEGGGHGLGLSIAKIIVLAHGGKIKVRTKPAMGTTFSILLPENRSKQDLHTQKGEIG